MPTIKRTLDIRLNRKVDEDVLRSIAMELKKADPKDYERTFIGYYLPGMTVDAGAWATHFNPDLEVWISKQGVGCCWRTPKSLKLYRDFRPL